MKKKLLFNLLGLAFFFCTTTVYAQESTTENIQILFRDYEWGTTMDEVIETEITPEMILEKDYVLSEDLLIIMDSSVGGYDCYTSFSFSDNKLVRGSYSLTEDHLNNIDYYNDYMALKDKYLEKYGTPSNEVTDWIDERYKNQPDKIGDAIALEDVVFFNAWLDDVGNNIVFACYGEDYKIHTAIQYSSAEQPETESSSDGI